MDNLNISDFGLKKITAKEATKVNGGGFPWGPVITIALAVEENWEEIKKGYNEEMASDG